MSLERNYKKELQSWLSDEESNFNMQYAITIEPTPELAFRYEEVLQRIRKISFEFSKEYQGNMFYRFKNKFDRFQFIVFKEIQKNKHYNILVHIPRKLNKRGSWYIKNFFENDFKMKWLMMKSSTFKGSNRFEKAYNRMFKHNNFSDKSLGLKIQKIKNKTGSVNYQSKKLKALDTKYDKTYFII